MKQTITNTGYFSSYADIGNNIRQVKHSIAKNIENKIEAENKIVEEICRVLGV